MIRGKGRGEKRVTRQIPTAVAKVLDEYLPLRSGRLEKNGDVSEGKLLINLVHRPGTSAGYYHLEDLVKSVSRRTGLDFSLHALRRLFGQMLYENGMNLFDIQQMMRHTNFSTTTINLHSLPTMENRANELIDQACGLAIH